MGGKDFTKDGLPRWLQGLSIILASVVVIALILGGALAWGPHTCKVSFPMVVGCSFGTYENLSGGLFAAAAAIFAGWMAWSAVQVQIAAEQARASADRIEVESVLKGDVDNAADGLGAVWKILEHLDRPDKQEDDDYSEKKAAVRWGLEQICKDNWLSTGRQMVTVLGWDRRQRYERLFSALESTREIVRHEDFEVFDALTEVGDAAYLCESVLPETGEYFEGRFRRSGKAWNLGYAIQVQAGMPDH